MKRLLLLFACWLSVVSLYAERVDVQTAQTVATNLATQMQEENSGMRSSSSAGVSLVYTAFGGSITPGNLKSGTNEADFYAFNIGSGQGFVIVSGEDRVHPVIGYSQKGAFKADKIPDNIKSWLEHYQEEITYAIKNNLQPSDKIQQEWLAYKSGIAMVAATAKVSLPTAEWNQGDPYNKMCPLIGGQRTLTGCVATAQSIIMKYHNHPTRATGGVSSYDGVTISYDNYKWENMLSQYNKGYSQTQADAVATLMFHCGANVEMDYGTEASGAVTALCAQSLIKNFGYDKQTRYIQKSRYNWDEWKELLNNELNDRRPVLYSGRSRSGGHAFVCDGSTSDGAYHINWGWGGYLNGNFLLTTLDAEGDHNGYSDDQGMTIGIQPAINSDYSYALRLYKSMSSDAKSVQQNTPFSLNVALINEGSADYTGYVNIALVDASYKIKEIISKSEQVNIELGGARYSWFEQKFNCTPTIALNNSDKVVAVYSPDGNNWEIAKGGSDMATEMSVTSGVIQPGKDDPNEPDAPLNISMFSNGFDGSYAPKGSNYTSVVIGFTSSDLSVPIRFRYKLKESSWRNKMTMSYGKSFDAINTPFKFESDGVAWMEANGHTIEYDQIRNYIKLEASETGTMEYEIAVYDPSKTTQYAKFDCSVQIVNPIQVSLSEIKGAKNTDIPFTLSVTDPGDFSRKQVRIQINSSSLTKENTTIKYTSGNSPETIVLSNPYPGSDNIEGEHTLSSLATTTYNYTFRSTSPLSESLMNLEIIDASNNQSIPHRAGTNITITDKEVPTPPEEVKYSPLQITNQGEQIGIATDQENMSKGSSCYLLAGAIKLSTGSFQGYMAVALTTGDHKIKEIISTPFDISFPDEYSWYSSFSFNCRIVNSTVESTDLIRLVSSTGSSVDDLANWSIVDGKNNETTNFIKAKGQEIRYHKITLPTVSGATIKSIGGSNADKVIHGWFYQFAVIPDDPSYTIAVKLDGKLIKPSITEQPTEYYIRSVTENKNITVEVFDPSSVNTIQAIRLTAGTLKSELTLQELACMKELTITGTMDARDFFTIRDNMFSLEKLNLAGVTIASYGNNPANGIPAAAFYIENLSNTTLKSILFPDNLTSINNDAFMLCSELKAITIPEKVTTYGINVFNSCRKLTNVTLKNPVPARINWCVFSGSNRENGTLTVPVGSQANYMAASEWNLFRTIIEARPESTEEEEFTSGLLSYRITSSTTVSITGTTDNNRTEYTIPSVVTNNGKSYDVKSIGTEAFNKCQNLKRFAPPASLDTIGRGAFSQCNMLETVLLPEGLIHIDEQAFEECTSLKTIEIPASVTFIGELSFMTCNQLSSIAVKANNANYASSEGVLYDKAKKTLLAYPNAKGTVFTIPQGVARIGVCAFVDCAITNITIPEGVTSIGEGAFDNCKSMQQITFPASLSYIDKEGSIFINCEETLKGIHCTNPVPLALEGDYPEYTFFYDSNLETGGLSKCILYVPKGSKEAYANAAGWKSFKNIEEEGEDLPAKPLVPISPDVAITIGNDHTYTDSEGGSDSFNGTVGTGNRETVINKLTINSTESKATTITFNWVTVGSGSTTSDASTTIMQTSNILINLLGSNSFGTWINNGTVKLTGNTNATLRNTTVNNNGIFTDETGLVTQVEGAAGLDISAPTDQEVLSGQSVTLIASTEVSSTYSLTFTWQQLQPDRSWIAIGLPNTITPNRSGLRVIGNTVSDPLTVRSDEAGTYRCVINNKVGNVSTTLTTQPATVTVKSTVDNATIDYGTKTYVRDRVLYIQTSVPTEIQIVNFNGLIIRNFRLPAGETRIDGLESGFYIIRFGNNQTVKITI